MKARINGNGIFIAFIIALFTVVFSVLVTNYDIIAKASGVNYNAELTVNQDGNAYTYTDGTETSGSFESLDLLLDDILANKEEGFNARLFFNDITTSNALTLSGGIIVFNGSLTYSSSNVEPVFITVERDGELRLSGASITTTNSAVILVEDGGNLQIDAGVLTVSEESNITTNALVNRGTTVVNSAVISNEASFTSYNGTQKLGRAILQNQSGANMVINDGSFIGAIAVEIKNGSLLVNDGEFKGTEGDGGSALVSADNAQVEVKGGAYISADETRTVVSNGSVDSQLAFLGGSIVGRLTLDASSSAKVRVSSSDVTYLLLPSEYGETYLYGEPSLTVENGCLGFQSSPNEGYYATKWEKSDGSYQTEEKSPLLASFTGGGSVRVVVNDEYSITLLLDGVEGATITKRYGQTLSKNDIDEALAVREGYEITSRTVDGVEIDTVYTVVKDASIVVVSELAVPRLNEFGLIEFTFNGNSQRVEAPLTEVTALSYEYVWEKQGNGWSSEGVNSQDGVMLVKNVADGGVYRLTVTVSDGVISKSATRVFTVSIVKGSYSSVEHEALSGVYSETKRLNEYALAEGFSWAEPLSVPTVSQRKYSAYYCLDELNYNVYQLEITLILSKAEAVLKSHAPLSGTYNEDLTLGDYALEGGWRWVDESVVPNVKNSDGYFALYAPNENYEEYLSKVKILLDKANYVSVPNLVIEVKYASGLNAYNAWKDCNDKQGYYFDDITEAKNTLIERLGDIPYEAYYNRDSDNYNDYEDVQIVISVSKGFATMQYPLSEVDGGVYAPNRTLSSVSLEPNWRWENPNELLFARRTEYKAIYNPNVALYDDHFAYVTVVVRKADVPESERVHAVLTGVYDPSKTLEDYALNDGWRWVDGSVTPTVRVTEYSAVYEKDENYNAYMGTVTLTLAKASYDLSSVVLADVEVTYDGREHSVECLGLPQGISVSYENNAKKDAGIYNVIVKFTQPDTDNYELIPQRTVRLTVKKAIASISVQDNQEFLYDGEDKFPSATLNNVEQRIISTSLPQKDVGKYTVKFYTEESSNYLSCERTVVYYINAQYRESGMDGVSSEGDVYVRLYDYSNGVNCDVTVSATIGSLTEDSFILNVVVGGTEQGGEYHLLALLPTSFEGKEFTVSCVAEGAETPVEVTQNGNYVSFKAEKAFGSYKFTLQNGTFDEGNSLEWWAILLITLGSVVFAGGVGALVFVLITLKKKGKLDEIISRFKKKDTKTTGEELTHEESDK